MKRPEGTVAIIFVIYFFLFNKGPCKQIGSNKTPQCVCGCVCGPLDPPNPDRSAYAELKPIPTPTPCFTVPGEFTMVLLEPL